MNKHFPAPKNRQPARPHFVQEWAELRGFKNQAELIRELGADKGIVSRWYDGATPGREWQTKLAALLTDGDEEALFRHPDDDWMARFLRGRKRGEIEKIKQTLEIAFPRRTGTDG